MDNNFGITKIGFALEKIAYELTFFRINYEAENTRRRIDETFKVNPLIKQIEENDIKVQKNIDDWRDYLHKYSLILISIAGFLLAIVTLNKSSIEISDAISGFIWLGISIGATFFAIFLTVFLQRRIIDGNFAFSQCCGAPNDKHPDEIHWSDAVRRNLKDSIDRNKQKLKEDCENMHYKEKRNLKKGIWEDTRLLKSMKYCGGTYSWLEKVRLFFTMTIVITSFYGVFALGETLISQRNTEIRQSTIIGTLKLLFNSTLKVD